ncbi:DHA2 family efflux MFS transporter permease subunit [Cellulomonas fimi]|uniref:Drug resistance transporter, EmrB/QacA subfamily n=1 Tax=Cellulomonas fimi (strain ATCC 484 / DSM 20113 / JCM 1341 / CCUG 24087 / LMG 16345 / NBRC 15513 / NCIMB 8980 / NCTC 7547 / NRS-133) TaxID=590998 RepID=F4GZA5_CELFA|nr:drug resistance transporter, EmrB/QacA subfamily [Cellulomonas fimi ATCC 484]VEH35632.1 High-copy suppressor of rspA [Cellulomonas fimi]
MTETPTVPLRDDPAASGAPAASPDRMSPRDRLAVTVLLVSTFVVILNETIMGVALPRLMTDLAITASTAQWLTTAFMLTMAVVIPVTGFVLQRITTRPAFLLAMTLFAVGTLICAIAPGFVVLLLGRIVQATGTAIMLPLLMTTVMTVTPPAARGRTMGNISVVISVAPAIGPTISGLILSVLSWRWMFGLVLPIAVVAILLGAARLPNVTEPRYAKVDVASVILSALGFGGIVYGLSGLGEITDGGVGTATWIALGVGAVTLVLFVLRQRSLAKVDDALLDLRVFSSRTFAVSVALLAGLMVSLFGVIILLPIYAQTVLGLTTLQTGLLLLPGGLLMGLLAPGVGRAYDRVGPRPLLIPGAVALSAALWGFTLLQPDSSPWMLLAGHLTMSAGLALMFTPLFTSALGSLPAERYSHGSAVVGTLQQVAGAAGTALFVTVLTAQSIALADEGASATAATAGGIHLAFLVGAVLSLATLPVVLAVPAKPVVAPHGGGH